MFYLINFILTFLLIIIFSKLAKNFKLVDYPNARKLHKGPVPLVGGISIFISILILIPFINLNYSFLIIILSSSIILFLGALDDAIELGVIVRLISQLIASLVVIGTGLSIIDIGDYYYFYPIQLGIFGILLTVFSVIGLTNAINFIDGIDGLCSGLILVALLSLFFYINLSGIDNELIEIKILIVSIFAFFLVNIGFSPFNKVFLGDAGSMALGFILSWLLIYYSHPSYRSIHPVLTIWCVALPIFDLLGVVIRRVLRGINPFKSDRRHIHHILLDLNISTQKVFLLLIIISIILSLIGGIVFFNFGPLPALLSYFISFSIYLYFSLFLSRKVFSNM
tara:strand:- start:624 stop:1637 length:1014 start_codon:yes stop_codon:yes gene_type:complete